MEAGRLRSEGESVLKGEEGQETANAVQEDVVDAMGNVIEVNQAKDKSDKEKKNELKVIEKKLKDHKKKPYLTDEEKWELEDRQTAIKEELEIMKADKKAAKAEKK